MDGSARQLSRRAFVRNAILTSVAAAAATTARPIGDALAQAAPPDGFPRLDVPEPVTGVASRPDRLLAVGGHAASPKVWARSTDLARWGTVADAAAFPPATSLLDATAHGGGFLAAGWSETADGPAPAVFGSADGDAWEPQPLPDGGPGVALAVAGGGGEALAVGAAFAEPDVREPARLVAFSSGPDGRWVRSALDGVRAPVHGGATMLASLPSGFLLATTGVEGSALFASPSAAGPWRAVRSPRTDEVVAFLAAARTRAGVLLAGLDALDRPRFFVDGGRGWREVVPPAGVDPNAHVVSLAETDRALVAAGDDGSGSFVEEVSAA